MVDGKVNTGSHCERPSSAAICLAHHHCPMETTARRSLPRWPEFWKRGTDNKATMNVISNYSTTWMYLFLPPFIVWTINLSLGLILVCLPIIKQTFAFPNIFFPLKQTFDVAIWITKQYFNQEGCLQFYLFLEKCFCLNMASVIVDNVKLVMVKYFNMTTNGKLSIVSP